MKKKKIEAKLNYLKQLLFLNPDQKNHIYIYVYIIPNSFDMYIMSSDL